MQVAFDEHVSPRIVRAISDTARLPENVELASVYTLGLTSSEDETWLERFSANGGIFFVSGDRKMLNRPTLLRIIRDSGLVGFYFRKEFAGQTRIRQLAYAAYWWEPIQKHFMNPIRGSAWVVPNDFNKTDIKRVDIDEAIRGLSAAI